MKTLTPQQIELIKKPLPKEAVTQHPTKTYLSSIKAIYVTERLNEVFWIWAWTIKTNSEKEWTKWMVVVKVILEIPDYWIYYESFWWNDNGWDWSKNFDLWDAYKWATTDAITKICSYIWIWIDVFKWKQNAGYSDKKEYKTEQKSWRNLLDIVNDMKASKSIEELDKFKEEWKITAVTEKQTEWLKTTYQETYKKLSINQTNNETIS